MFWLVNISIVVVTMVSMEIIAWLTHKYVMHGFLWGIHKDHHLNKKESWLEENDWFFVIFATPSMLLFYFSNGIIEDYKFWMACGISIYGALYFVIHDIFIHQRFKILSNSNNRYLKAIRRAHKMHHKHINKEDGECFGMLFVPKKYFDLYKKQKS